MGKKRKTQVFVLKPWCWYCEREFEDEKVLLQHQKSKHFKCQLCPRKLNTAGGLMVHSQQVHKCEPEPLTNTLPGRDGYDIEIFGMEGVPTNALAEWKARKESEAGSAAFASAAAAKRPRHSYTVIPEADLQAALAQHKALMAARDNPAPLMQFTFPPASGMPPFLPPGIAPGFPPNFPPNMAMPPPTFAPAAAPGFAPPPGFVPPFPSSGAPAFPGAAQVPLQPAAFSSATPPRPSPAQVLPVGNETNKQTAVTTDVLPKDGVMWPDTAASPAEKRALQGRYRYTSPTPDGQAMALEDIAAGRKRKAAADFL
ncbi:hypothetical protein BCR39DRAFT_514562 [Naematelia encephala]|uniref:C2H2-type domain-containing protein n=1 Tax=Naematelia encephala TaxID=71784 RepID=A0A1Y2BJ02_9TREE|nr:hypothetical protein BCR39DRAFT_514562 [Naematelia encephala]